MQRALSFSVETDINNDELRPSGSGEGVRANTLPKLEAIVRGQASVIEVILAEKCVLCHGSLFFDREDNHNLRNLVLFVIEAETGGHVAVGGHGLHVVDLAQVVPRRDQRDHFVAR